MACGNDEKDLLNLRNFAFFLGSAAWELLFLGQFISESLGVEDGLIVFDGFGVDRVPSGEWAKIKICINLFPDKILTIKIPTNNNIPELHAITSQGAGLISQDILHLSKLLIDTDSMALDPAVIDATVHFLVPFHEDALEHFDELKGDD